MLSVQNICISSALPVEAKQEPLVKVVYKKELRANDLVKEVSKLDNPEVIVWYIGEKGLSRQGTNFYKKNLFLPFTRLPKPPPCWLYDLTAWRALWDITAAPSNCSQLVESVDGLALEKFKCMKSSDFFRWMQSRTSQSEISYIKATLLKRAFIYQKSIKKNKTNGLTIEQVFKNSCPALEDLKDLDTGKCYSALQYLEGCFQVLTLVENALTQTNSAEVNLVFALPNDEADYYRDSVEEFAPFVKDLAFFLKEKFGSQLSRKINLYFFSFMFGATSERPYNKPDLISTITSDDFLKK